MPDAAVAAAQIPSSFYVIAGTLIVANLGTLLTVLVYIFKGGMFVAETKAGIKDAKDAAVRAHKRIDKLESTEGEICQA